MLYLRDFGVLSHFPVKKIILNRLFKWSLGLIANKIECRSCRNIHLVIGETLLWKWDRSKLETMHWYASFNRRSTNLPTCKFPDGIICIIIPSTMQGQYHRTILRQHAQEPSHHTHSDKKMNLLIIRLGVINNAIFVTENNIITIIGYGLQSMLLSKFIDGISTKALNPVTSQFDISISKRGILGASYRNSL